MKRFTFTLERVLAWRRMQARLERLRWQQIGAERRGIETEQVNLSLDRERSAADLIQARSASSEDLAALDRFRKHIDCEQVRLGGKYAQCEKLLAAQAEIVSAKERDVKVLEHLREHKLAAWTAEWDRETEQVAAEAFLSRWLPRGSSE